jgi:hypothetical protein
VSVTFGLAMSGRLARRPEQPAKLSHLHESLTPLTLALIVCSPRKAAATPELAADGKQTLQAYLNEFPDYYTRLAKMEADADAYWARRGHSTEG